MKLSALLLAAATGYGAYLAATMTADFRVVAALGIASIGLLVVAVRRRHCAACGRPDSIFNPLGVADDGARVHRSHFRQRSSGYFGRKR